MELSELFMDAVDIMGFAEFNWLLKLLIRLKGEKDL